jgi:hypothetical protein
MCEYCRPDRDRTMFTNEQLAAGYRTITRACEALGSLEPGQVRDLLLDNHSFLRDSAHAAQFVETINNTPYYILEET